MIEFFEKMGYFWGFVEVLVSIYKDDWGVRKL